MYRRLTLFSPDGDGEGGGGTPAPAAPAPTSTPAPTEVTGVPAQPAPTQPAGQFVSHDDFERLNRADAKARESDRTFGKVKELGFDSMDAALAALTERNAILSDPARRSIFDALNQPAASPQTDSPQEATPDLKTLINQQFAERDHAQLQERFTADAAVESRLLADLTSSDQFKPVFGDLSFDDALQGKGENPSATAMAVLINNELTSRSQNVNGTLFPITDQSVINDAVKGAQAQMRSLKALTLLEASQGSPGLDRPTQQGVANVPVEGETREQAAAREKEAVDATFRNSYEAALKGEVGLGLE